MKFVVSLYRKQVEEGRVFLHEQPSNAKSWILPEIRGMMKELGAHVVEADHCMFGLRTWGATKQALSPAQKPTQFMPNSRALGS